MIFPTLIVASDAPASYFLSAAAQTPIIASEVATETNTVVRLRRLNPVIHELQFALTSFAGMRCLGQRRLFRLASSRTIEHQPSSVGVCAKTSASSARSPTQKCRLSSEDHLYKPPR